ncbi:type 1 glutamine amidotransferase [Paroceanicella profunda]|uniref:Type 1 glutamine amidotransferase n=1 Tax=Paroceanicella profunda TaxID=2579971 RepID=A0A5B8FX36_9RHOB|nr:type 1 glutamine amidotransferase [Paroceanicella profunda]QDL92144.1 type 1 glutamine amidotransferase [Paroceanicella profunda]
MRIGILETGDIPAYLVDAEGSYPAMFARMLLAEDPRLSFQTVSVVHGETPSGPHQADAWIITGSRHGVYDDLPFIAPLKQFISDCVAAGVPLAGICFGHQILAEALGGRAVKSEKGWGLGAQDYPLVNRPSWMEGSAAAYTGLAVHQDQVVALPAEATVLSASPFCEIAAVAYGDAERPSAISVQSHPEFSPAVVRAIVKDRRDSAAIGKPLADAALASLETPLLDNPWPRWILSGFRRSLAARAA